MNERIDLDAATQAAWTRFRQRVADHVAEMATGEELSIVCAALVDDPDGEGAPSVAVAMLDGDLVELDHAAAGAPLVLDRRSADEVAARLVTLLRETYAVPHPSFLRADGLEVEASLRRPHDVPEPAAPHGLDDDDREGYPHDRDHLVAMVHAALGEFLHEPTHLDDGSTSIASGESVLYVRIHRTRPSVVLSADIVLDPDAPDAAERLDHELRLLDGLHPLWKFSHHDGRVRMSHEIVARPFVAATVQMLVRRFITEVDQIACALVVRVGGRRYLEDEPVEDERDLVMSGLLELLHLERVRATTVAGLFDHDRIEIIRQLVRIRQGAVSCGDHDPEVVLEALRKALRVVADGEPAATVVRPAAPRRTVQDALLDGLDGLAGLEATGGDEALDLGWSA